MTVYEIKQNTEYGSIEIYFNDKPAEEIRTALKAMKFRWHSLKKCWYGRAAEHEVISAINNATPEEKQTETAIVTDGYLGAGGIHGGKSHLNLYGQDLKKAIAADIKKAGIRGVTIAMRHGNPCVTVTTAPEDLKTFEEFEKDFSIECNGWIYYRDENGDVQSIHSEKYFYDLTAAEQQEIRTRAARFEYYKEAESRNTLNHYYIDRYLVFSQAGFAKIKAICRIIESYRYDESNSMVDYFDTNFYYDIVTKPAIA